MKRLSILLALALFSCDAVLVHSPLPTNTEALKTWPSEFTGNWKGDDMQVSFLSDRMIMEQSQIRMLEPGQDYLKSHKLLFIKDTAEHKLSHGYPYIEENGGIRYEVTEKEEMVLGLNWRLMPLQSGYLLNYRDQAADWWNMLYLKFVSADELEVWTLEKEDLPLLSDCDELYRHESNTGNVFYLWCDIDQARMDELIDQGLFSHIDEPLVLKRQAE